MNILPPSLGWLWAVILGAGMLCGNVHADGVAWEYKYEADEPPVQATPQWAGNTHVVGSSEAINNGRLEVEVDSTASRYYTMGYYSGGRPAGDAAWNGDSGTSTIEIRVSCTAENPEKDIFRLNLADGKLRWEINFRSGSIVAGDKTALVDTGTPDTYRIVLDGDVMHMTSETGGVVFDAIKGSKLVDDRNSLIFGTDARNSQDSGGGSWVLDFVRWTNKEAAP